jgi:hypothetical protein
MARPKVSLYSEYSDLWHDVRVYFACYGGVPKIIYSPYTHFALLLTLICWGQWHSTDWTAIPLSVLPALLGFTLAAYALLLGFGDESFRKFLASSGKPEQTGRDATSETTLMGVSAIFLHFVVVEIVALLCAIVGAANPLASLGWSEAVAHGLAGIRLGPQFPHLAFAFIGLFAFYLSILMALAAAIDIFHATGWYVQYANTVKKKEAQKAPGAEKGRGAI